MIMVSAIPSIGWAANYTPPWKQLERVLAYTITCREADGSRQCLLLPLESATTNSSTPKVGKDWLAWMKSVQRISSRRTRQPAPPTALP